ncbi:methyltransferase domain-containing protein [Xanthovirga aplysinae]|uniref:methyltransferase domain-containing protein n=1 Tax=Xanthovirga aplysinae TaxID=2529853 RepID=UPI0012BC6D90|nr:methyltransferase domain-containing protein [Xanthovirga aplysinae]MTI30588.1 methyltransferase domain-containing protein [Xanthovirga aplysinae]
MNWDTALYNEKHAFVYDYGKELIDLLQPKENERILDLGCGSGQLTKRISIKAKEVLGIDKSAEMVSSAQSNYPEIQFLEMDASSFRFSKPFDAIFSNATLHWVTDFKSAIRSMFENLKVGGRVVVEFGGKGNVEKIVNGLRKSLKKHGYDEQSRFEQWYFPSIGEYSVELEEAGFGVVQAEHYDRLTELADEETGIKDWLEMFAKGFFFEVSNPDIATILKEVQEQLRSELFQNKKWYADYKRIRIVAKKESL